MEPNPNPNELSPEKIQAINQLALNQSIPAGTVITFADNTTFTVLQTIPAQCCEKCNHPGFLFRLSQLSSQAIYKAIHRRLQKEARI